MISAHEALWRLQEGNMRFVSNEGGKTAGPDRKLPGELVEAQHPFAIILGCSDSRVPPEIIFDQDLGDLFVIRVAGNIATPTQIGSIEYAAVHCGTPLIVVLGHSGCGAVQATLETLQDPPENLSPNLSSIIDHIRPFVEKSRNDEYRIEPDAFLRLAVKANIAAAVHDLWKGSEIIDRLIRSVGLVVMGAEYSLETGIVEFFDSMRVG